MRFLEFDVLSTDRPKTGKPDKSASFTLITGNMLSLFHLLCKPFVIVAVPEPANRRPDSITIQFIKEYILAIDSQIEKETQV